MSECTFVVPKKASQILGVHYQTLRAWDAKGKIETIRMDGGKRLYNVKKYIRDNNLQEEAEIIRHNICYCRVSSASQKDDLERQVAFMKNKYPNHEIMTDIGSGINFKRKKLD
jgi:putative resolvase